MFISRHRLFYSQIVLLFRILLVVLLLQWSCQDIRGIEARPRKKVVNGSPAPQGRFPYMCSLRIRGGREHVCGGTLIKSRWVLTAAHCVDRVRGAVRKSLIVYCGIYEREERNVNKTFAADRRFVHPQWNGELLDGYDLALIKLNRASDSPLPDLPAQGSHYMPGNVFSALGWGLDSSGRFTDLLQIADPLPFVSTRSCNLERYWAGQIKESMICAGIGDRDTAEGDAGGPLLLLDFPDNDYTLGEASYDLLAGITSFQRGSEQGFLPSVYTSIGYFRDWIDCITEEQGNCSNASQGTTESPTGAKETSSTTKVNSPMVVESSQRSPSSENVIMSLESLAKSPEEETSDFEFSFDGCLGTTTDIDLSETLALKRALSAIKEDDSETVAEILCGVLSPNVTLSLFISAPNWTLLHETAEHDAFESATILIYVGANLERPSGLYDDRPLHTSAKYNSSNVAKVLIDSGAAIAAKNSFRNSPLHIAAVYNAADVAKILIDSGASLGSRNTWGATPLHFCAHHNSVSVAKLLIDAGAGTSRKDRDKRTPLHYAARYESLEVAEVLVESGADLDAQDTRGNTPLHMAARYYYRDIGKLLINNGASRWVENMDEDTPFDVICEDALCMSLQVTWFQELFQDQ